MGVRAWAGVVGVFVLGSSIDWTQVLLELIAIMPSLVAAYFAYRIHLNVRTPSGEALGVVSEQTHHLASVNTAMLKDVHRATANGESTPAGEAAARREPL